MKLAAVIAAGDDNTPVTVDHVRSARANLYVGLEGVE